MRSLRKAAYAALLGMSMFTLQPTLAGAEEVHGAFTLSHEVRCQKIVLRPGNYTFSIRSMGSSEFMTVRSLDSGVTAMLLVNDVETPKPDEASHLVLVSRDGKSFVSSMNLRDYDMTLRFAVPHEIASK